MNLGTQINQEGTQTEEQATPHHPRPGLSSGRGIQQKQSCCPSHTKATSYTGEIQASKAMTSKSFGRSFDLQ